MELRGGGNLTDLAFEVAKGGSAGIVFPPWQPSELGLAVVVILRFSSGAYICRRTIS